MVTTNSRNLTTVQPANHTFSNDDPDVLLFNEAERDRINEAFEVSQEKVDGRVIDREDALGDGEPEDIDFGLDLDPFEQFVSAEGVTAMLDEVPERAYILLYELESPLEVVVLSPANPLALSPDIETLRLSHDADDDLIYVGRFHANEYPAVGYLNPVIGYLRADSAQLVHQHNYLLDQRIEVAEIVFMRGQMPELQLYGMHPHSLSDRLDALADIDGAAEKSDKEVTAMMSDLSEPLESGSERAQSAAISEELQTGLSRLEVPEGPIEPDDEFEEIEAIDDETIVLAEDSEQEPYAEVMTVAQQNVALTQAHLSHMSAEHKAFAVLSQALENSQTDWLHYNGAIVFRSGIEGQDTAVVDMQTSQTVLYHDAEHGELRGTLPDHWNYDREFEQLLLLPTLIKVLSRAVAEPPQMLSPG